jgi:hypothetical protein
MATMSSRLDFDVFGYYMLYAYDFFCVFEDSFSVSLCHVS